MPPRPEGIWGAVLLPLDRAGAIDMGALAEVVERLADAGLAGVYTNGTAAEFFNQTEAEFDAVTALVIERARARALPFQIGVSCTNPRVARARLARLRGCGATAAQVILPDWWPPARDEQLRFLAGMAEAGQGMPLVLYNPPHAKCRLEVEDIAALAAEVPALVGVKVAGGDAGWFARRRALLGALSVFVAGHRVATGRFLGADGAYSNVACLAPAGAARHWRQIETDPEAALDLERRFARFLSETLVPLAKTHALSDAALDKLMAAAGGWGPVGPALLWPHNGATPEMVAAVRARAEALLPDLLAQ
ncbi:hypothetical protein OG2516_00869 [Oceanicola granulosus HTCC2516]|uniref:Dihydrodipicolinate synthase family protein n=1 Tax=Oceanicola granulosus (strain ATCC BAA-861 / DSM 15982 / KCTC 12143 / HTCC2516) TaxID=314256 RepID=Q2CJ66_OCEGH|nr:dihydrodipicolinate synthase family protein [Oceanicola granulosus]EAR52734.1 hypothetical protein OG2516_00869 [Oceanicola granulosus HTCC2516]